MMLEFLGPQFIYVYIYFDNNFEEERKAEMSKLLQLLAAGMSHAESHGTHFLVRDVFHVL
jgi:hypothetical protein